MKKTGHEVTHVHGVAKQDFDDLLFSALLASVNRDRKEEYLDDLFRGYLLYNICKPYTNHKEKVRKKMIIQQ